MARISIIIPVYEGWPNLEKCLRYLSQNSFQDFQVLIIDHGLHDEKIVADFHAPKSLDIVHLKASPELWWSGATNAGIRKALETRGPDYIMLLNHDCFLDQDAISQLVDVADTNKNSIVAPVQVDAESGRILVRLAYTAYLLGFPTVIPPPKQEKIDQPVSMHTGLITGGRGVLIPRQVFDSVGLMDEKGLPHYGADNDFYLRCKSSGYHLLIANRAIVYVDKAQTTAAAKIGKLTMRQFLATLRDRKSHRNLPELMVHFRKHYPIPGLYLVGVTLNILRYTSIYFLFRIANVFAAKSRPDQ